MYSSRMTRIVTLAKRLTTPLLPDDYLTLFNPLLTFDSYRARFSQVTEEMPGVRTLQLQTVRALPPFTCGQHIRVGIDLNGVRHVRSFSITSAATGVPSRELTITVKATGEGGVSDHLVHRATVGDIVHLEPPSGEFTLPFELPHHLVMIAAGSGVTPLLSMVRTLAQTGHRTRVTFVLGARTTQEMIHRSELVALSEDHDWFELILWPSAALGHFDRAALQREVPDWQSAQTYVCGPPGLLTQVDSIWRSHDALDRLHTEQFQTRLAKINGKGGTISFTKSQRTKAATATTSLLQAGEDADVLMPSGCRAGICHTCVVPLKAGKLRDLRTGELHGEPGDMVQTCVNAAACDVELDV